MKWFRSLNIQGKLFAVFGIIVLAGALAIAANLVSTILVGSGVDQLRRQYEKQDEAYTALDLLQGYDLAELSWELGMDSGDYAEVESQLHKWDRYSVRLDDFTRRALLRAEDPLEKDALYTFERTKEEHTQTFLSLIDAMLAEDQAEVDRLSAQSGDEITLLYDQLGSILDKGDKIMAATDSQQAVYQVVAILVGLVALALFLVLAVVTAVVVTNQVNRPVLLLQEAAAAVEERRFDPALLEKLAGRPDEIGRLAREFSAMAAAVQQREQGLQHQAVELRARIEQQSGQERS